MAAGAGGAGLVLMADGVSSLCRLARGWRGERGAGLRRVRGTPARGGWNVATRGRGTTRAPRMRGPRIQCRWVDDEQTQRLRLRHWSTRSWIPQVGSAGQALRRTGPLDDGGRTLRAGMRDSWGCCGIVRIGWFASGCGGQLQAVRGTVDGLSPQHRAGLVLGRETAPRHGVTAVFAGRGLSTQRLPTQIPCVHGCADQ